MEIGEALWRDVTLAAASLASAQVRSSFLATQSKGASESAAALLLPSLPNPSAPSGWQHKRGRAARGGSCRHDEEKGRGS